MSILFALVMLLSMLIFIVGIVWLLISLLSKKKLKKPLVAMGASVILFVVSIIGICVFNDEAVKEGYADATETSIEAITEDATSSGTVAEEVTESETTSSSSEENEAYNNDLRNFQASVIDSVSEIAVTNENTEHFLNVVISKGETIAEQDTTDDGEFLAAIGYLLRNFDTDSEYWNAGNFAWYIEAGNLIDNDEIKQDAIKGLGLVATSLGMDAEETATETGNETMAAEEPETTSTNTSVTAEYKSALKKAGIYAQMNMSKMAIYDQLISEFEKFPEDAAQYAIDNLEWDYKENALGKAKTYQEMGMSNQAIYDQLISEFERFTAEEAQYAIDNLD